MEDRELDGHIYSRKMWKNWEEKEEDQIGEKEEEEE